MFGNFKITDIYTSTQNICVLHLSKKAKYIPIIITSKLYQSEHPLNFLENSFPYFCNFTSNSIALCSHPSSVDRRRKYCFIQTFRIFPLTILLGALHYWDLEE